MNNSDLAVIVSTVRFAPDRLSFDEWQQDACALMTLEREGITWGSGAFVEKSALTGITPKSGIRLVLRARAP